MFELFVFLVIVGAFSIAMVEIACLLSPVLHSHRQAREDAKHFKKRL